MKRSIDLESHIATKAPTFSLHVIALSHKTNRLFVSIFEIGRKGKPMAKNADRTEKTRGDIVDAAVRLFGKHGFAAVSTPMLADEAGVSRGAIYHHFASKAAILEAAVETELTRIAQLIDQSGSEASDPLEQLVEGGDAFLRAMTSPTARQIILIDGPAVLGPQRINEIDAATTSSELTAGILHAQEAGRLPRDINAAALTSLMTGAYDRAAIDGHAASEESALAAAQAIRALWFGLSRLA